jgi:hypothetical protein
MSLYNVDHKAHQAQNDPNAHAAQAAQQNEVIKNAALQRGTVQRVPEADGEVKIRDGGREKNKGDQRNKRRQDSSAEEEAEPERKVEDGGRLDFLA